MPDENFKWIWREKHKLYISTLGSYFRHKTKNTNNNT